MSWRVSARDILRRYLGTPLHVTFGGSHHLAFVSGKSNWLGDEKSHGPLFFDLPPSLAIMVTLAITNSLEWDLLGIVLDGRPYITHDYGIYIYHETRNEVK
jgi:hypothetical protein